MYASSDTNIVFMKSKSEKKSKRFQWIIQVFSESFRWLSKGILEIGVGSKMST